MFFTKVQKYSKLITQSLTLMMIVHLVLKYVRIAQEKTSYLYLVAEMLPGK